MSTQEVGKYRQFFDVDEKYFPCIDDSAIEAGAPWENTYPHETFIELLKNVEWDNKAICLDSWCIWNW